MILRMLISMLALGSSFTSPLFASAVRGERFFIEGGGLPGVAGVAGIPGVAGTAGLPGGPAAFAFADFYALNPPNAQTVTASSPVAFPNAGSTSTGGVITSNPSGTIFTLVDVGTYKVEFQVSVTPSSGTGTQLQLSINGVPDGTTVVGQAVGGASSQLVGVFYETTSTANSILEVINPAGNNTLIVTPAAAGGIGVDAVSAHLVITRIR